MSHAFPFTPCSFASLLFTAIMHAVLSEEYVKPSAHSTLYLPTARLDRHTEAAPVSKTV